MSAYELSQRFRYDYDGPVTDLHQRLVVLPPPVHGDQVRLWGSVRSSIPEARRSERVDDFGNVVVELVVPRVEASITFDVEVAVERAAPARPHLVEPDPIYLRPTRLTTPDDALEGAAATLADAGHGGRALAERVSTWVRAALPYGFGDTGVWTAAAEALVVGRGVCQDHAHVMLTLCRLAGLPARYVSGHLLGEGGSHAWVEVLVAHPGGCWEAVAIDPCNDRAAGAGYVTVAVGRDYADVAPVSGHYDSPHAGVLTTSKRAGALVAA